MLRSKIGYVLFGILLLGSLGLWVKPAEVEAQASCKATDVRIKDLPASTNPLTNKDYLLQGGYSACTSPTNLYCVRVKSGNQVIGTTSCTYAPDQGLELQFSSSGAHTLEAYVADELTGNYFEGSFFSKTITIGPSTAKAGEKVVDGVKPDQQQSAGGGAGSKPAVTASDPNAVVGTFNLPTKYGSLGAFIVGVINFVLAIIGALALLFIIIGGVRMVTSAGNENAVTAGKKTVTWAVIGLVVALLAFTIIAGLEALLSRA